MSTRTLGIVAIALIAAACSEPATEPHFASGGGEEPAAPSAIAMYPAAPAPGIVVTFDSGDLGSGLRSWEFGDGAIDTGTVVSHAFMNAGVYQVRLVLDDGGQTREHSIQVLVEEVSSEPARAIPEQLRRGD